MVQWLTVKRFPEEFGIDHDRMLSVIRLSDRLFLRLFSHPYRNLMWRPAQQKPSTPQQHWLMSQQHVS